MPFAQDLIHKLEVGGGMRYLKIALAVLAVVGFTVAYNFRAFRNMSTQEAMDSAQLARNLSEGKGYTTLFVRPLSMYLLKNVNEKRGLAKDDSKVPDYSRIRAPHPDIANPPVYPVVLAGLLKLPLNEDALTKKPFWSSDGYFYRYQPDFAISLFNQALFFVLIAAVYFLARRLFDPTVALLSALLLFGTELFWRFAVSGLSTLLVMLVFTGLLWCLHFVEREGREPQWKPWAAFGLAALSGVLVGTGCLTRYAFGWLIIPLVAYLAIFAGPRRWVLGLVALLSFMVVISPWVVRNIHLSGMPFGTATFAALENTGIYPDNRLLRSLTPNFERVLTAPLWYKLMQNTRIALTTDAPRFSGNWVSAFFVVGLMMNFRSLAIRRLRYFILLCLPVLVIVQAMGRTTLSDEWPEVNSENLLVLLAPIVIVYGVSFFLVLLDQIELPLKGLRYVIMGVFGALVCLPMLLVFVTPRDSNTKVVAYPPYHPPMIQQIAGWMKKDELLMSDIPWAVAWYGRRQCVWLTLNTEKDYFSINDTQKPIRGLYLTPQTMDSKFLTQWVRAGERSWGNFILDTMLRREVPPWFPLRAAPSGFLPEQLFLADWERWRIGAEPGAAPAVVAPAPKP